MDFPLLSDWLANKYPPTDVEKAAYGSLNKSGQERAYSVWANIKKRCRSSSCPDWGRYGGRGIDVCDEWADSFEKFYAYMGDPPKGYQIDRADNDGNYEPGNCKWVTPEENGNNKRNTVYLTVDGERKTIHQWCKQLGLDKKAVKSRFYFGCTHKRALGLE